ncbi:MAG: hypothetical protein QM723_18650 [Myxococcaceae bacterium]
MRPLGLLLLLSACSVTTPAGPTGPRLDLRAHLPAAVVAHAPDDAHAEKHQLRVELGVPPAQVELVWYSMHDGANAYLLSTEAQVVTPGDGVEVGGPTAGNPVNAGTAEAVYESMPVQLKWTHKHVGSTSLGTDSYEIRASGAGRKL